MLKTFLKLSFTTDVWSEPSANVSLLSLTAHGITEDFTRMKIVLKYCSLHGRHTGDIICKFQYDATGVEHPGRAIALHC